MTHDAAWPAAWHRDSAVRSRLLSEGLSLLNWICCSDPGRQGMSRKLLVSLADCGARRIIYVSCNPATQVLVVTGLKCQTVAVSEAEVPNSGSF